MPHSTRHAPPVTDLLSAAAPALTSRPYGCAPADAKPHRAAPLTCVISPDPRLLLPPPLRARPGQSTTSPQEYTAHIHAIKKSTGRGGSAATPSSQRLGSRGPCVRAETSVRTPARVTRRAATREHASAPRTAVPAALTAGGRCWPKAQDRLQVTATPLPDDRRAHNKGCPRCAILRALDVRACGAGRGAVSAPPGCDCTGAR